MRALDVPSEGRVLVVQPKNVRVPITVRGSERQREVRNEEAADQRADERRDQREQGE